MSKENSQRHNNPDYADDTRSDNWQDSRMMAHLVEAMKKGEDIGHYGRLVFVMVARFFMNTDEMVRLLEKQPDMDEQSARALVLQVEQKDYNPPKRDRILEWQSMQDFPICPDPEDPNSCNVYRELRFPDEIYANIGEFWMEKSEAVDSEE